MITPRSRRQRQMMVRTITVSELGPPFASRPCPACSIRMADLSIFFAVDSMEETPVNWMNIVNKET